MRGYARPAYQAFRPASVIRGFLYGAVPRFTRRCAPLSSTSAHADSRLSDYAQRLPPGTAGNSLLLASVERIAYRRA